jgi:hypothetical protein
MRLSEAIRDARSKARLELAVEEEKQKKIEAERADKVRTAARAVLEEIPEKIYEAAKKCHTEAVAYYVPSHEYKILDQYCTDKLRVQLVKGGVAEEVENQLLMEEIQYEVRAYYKSNTDDPMNHYRETVCEIVVYG